MFLFITNKALRTVPASETTTTPLHCSRPSYLPAATNTLFDSDVYFRGAHLTVACSPTVATAIFLAAKNNKATKRFASRKSKQSSHQEANTTISSSCCALRPSSPSWAPPPSSRRVPSAHCPASAPRILPAAPVSGYPCPRPFSVSKTVVCTMQFKRGRCVV